MLFTRFKQTAEKYYNRPALNGMLYAELLELVESDDYVSVSDGNGVRVLIDILIASRHGASIVVPPLVQENYSVVEKDDGFGLYLYSSGTTGGTRVPFKLTDKMIVSNAMNSIACHNMTFSDIIYTVCSMHHTGGINAQSIAGLLCGAHVIVESFDPRIYFKRLSEVGATITHLVPRMIDSLLKIKNTYPLRLEVVMCGSDCVRRQHVEYFTNMGVDFISNYGLTQAGPVLINHKFTSDSDLSVFDKPDVLLGTLAWCETMFIGTTMYVKGDAISGDEWLNTGDCIYKNNEWYMYRGRSINGVCQKVAKA
jgi:hypothetical protein